MRLHAHPGLLRLLTVRLGSQITDGAFQAALGGAILFNPERQTDPLAIAAGLAVLLLPYSLIGPFAGALLDHWDRRSVLIWANVLRAITIGLVALTMATGTSDTFVLLTALMVTGTSRFVASGLSASLPHVASREHLVATNAAFTTLGSGALAVGAGLTMALRAIFGADNTGSAATLLGGVALALVVAVIAASFTARSLGPDHADGGGVSAARAVTVGLFHGARAVARTPSVASALTAIGAHRIVFGINTLMLLIMTRHSAFGGGITGIGMVAGFIAVGMFIAAPVAPIAVRRYGRHRTLVAALTVGLCAELTLLTFNSTIICIAAVFIGLIGQVAKLCGDSAMQTDIADDRRGQVFAFQDAVFNIAYVAAITVAALLVSEDGQSPGLVVIGVVVYALGVVAVLSPLARRIAHRQTTHDAHRTHDTNRADDPDRADDAKRADDAPEAALVTTGPLPTGSTGEIAISPDAR